MIALLVGELEEHLLAFGILEPLAVTLEELVGPALARDADHQGALVVDASPLQLLGAGREQTVCRALEEEERRPRFELGIAREQLR